MIVLSTTDHLVPFKDGLLQLTIHDTSVTSYTFYSISLSLHGCSLHSDTNIVIIDCGRMCSGFADGKKFSILLYTLRTCDEGARVFCY